MSSVLLLTLNPLVEAKANSVNNETANITRDKQPEYVNVDGVKINRNPNLPINPDTQQNSLGATKVKQLEW